MVLKKGRPQAACPTRVCLEWFNAYYCWSGGGGCFEVAGVIRSLAPEAPGCPVKFREYTFTSTRRFSCRAARVLFSAFGNSLPTPSSRMHRNGTFFSTV